MSAYGKNFLMNSLFCFAVTAFVLSELSIAQNWRRPDDKLSVSVDTNNSTAPRHNSIQATMSLLPQRENAKLPADSPTKRWRRSLIVNNNNSKRGSPGYKMPRRQNLPIPPLRKKIGLPNGNILANSTSGLEMTRRYNVSSPLSSGSLVFNSDLTEPDQESSKFKFCALLALLTDV